MRKQLTIMDVCVEITKSNRVYVYSQMDLCGTVHKITICDGTLDRNPEPNEIKLNLADVQNFISSGNFYAHTTRDSMVLLKLENPDTVIAIAGVDDLTYFDERSLNLKVDFSSRSLKEIENKINKKECCDMCKENKREYKYEDPDMEVESYEPEENIQVRIEDAFNPMKTNPFGINAEEEAKQTLRNFLISKGYIKEDGIVNEEKIDIMLEENEQTPEHICGLEFTLEKDKLNIPVGGTQQQKVRMNPNLELEVHIAQYELVTKLQNGRDVNVIELPIFDRALLVNPFITVHDIEILASMEDVEEIQLLCSMADQPNKRISLTFRTLAECGLATWIDDPQFPIEMTALEFRGLTSHCKEYELYGEVNCQDFIK